MSYSTVEAGVLDVVRKDTRFSAQNSARGDERILSRGRDVTCVLRYGGVTPTHVEHPNVWSFEWIVIADLWFKSLGELPFYNQKIAEYVDAFMDIVLAYPTLDGVTGVNRVRVGAANDPLRWQGERRDHWVVTLPVLVVERQTITVAE